MGNKVQVTANSMNALSGGDVLYERGDAVDSIGLLAKGRVEAVSNGVRMVFGSGNFLGAYDVARGEHTFTYTAKDDVTVYILSVKGPESVENLLKAKQEYCGLLVTSLNYMIVDLQKRLVQLKKESDSLFDFMNQQYLLCDEVGRSSNTPVDTASAQGKFEKYSPEGVQLPEKAEYYRQCASLPVEVQKRYFSGSVYIAFYHYQEQCHVAGRLLDACRAYGELMYKYFRNLIMDEDSLFHSIGKLALSMAGKGMRNALIDRAVDEIVSKINDTEVFLTEKAGMEINLDRGRMEKLYLTLLSGETMAEDEFDELDAPGVETLYNSLEQITEYAEIEGGLKSEFIENVETFTKLANKFDRTPEASKLRKKIASGFFEIYETVFVKSMDDTALPTAVKLFLDFGFVSEKLMTDEELKTILALRPIPYRGGEGCRVYSMREWLKAVYDGEKETSKNEFDLDYEAHLRELVKEKSMDKKDIPKELADRKKRLHFECQNALRYADKVVSGNISTFVPILCSDGIFNNINNSYLTEDKINQAVKKVEEVDFSVFYRDRMATFEKMDGVKATVIDRITPDVVLFPVYGKNCQMWQDISGKRRSSKGRFFMPVLFEKDVESEMIRLLAAFRWEKCRTDMGNRWNDFRYPSLTSEYSDYLQFYRKNSELSPDTKAKIKAQLQQCNNRHKEVFAKDYADWILRESRGAMKLSRVSRAILFTYCPLSKPVYQAIEGQTAYSDAAKKYIIDNKAANKTIDMLIRRFEKDRLAVPDELRKTSEYLNG